jgi:hypothetical protein
MWFDISNFLLNGNFILECVNITEAQEKIFQLFVSEKFCLKRCVFNFDIGLSANDEGRINLDQ